MDYYAVLEIGEEADQESIRTAFRTLARRFHPDAGRGSSAERFRLIVEAYDTLGDPERRRRYDRFRRRPAPPPAYVEPLTRDQAEPLASRRAAIDHMYVRFARAAEADDLFAAAEALFRQLEHGLFWGPRLRRY